MRTGTRRPSSRMAIAKRVRSVKPTVAGTPARGVRRGLYPRSPPMSSALQGPVRALSMVRWLIVVRGGKFTTHGTMARHALDRAGWKDRRAPAGKHLVGGASAASTERDAERLAAAFGLDAGLVRRLVGRHGDETPALLELGRSRDLLRPLDSTGRYLEAEVLWAVEKELALSLDDVLARRLRLAIETRDHGASVAARAAAIAGYALGWTDSERERAVASYVEGAHREYDVPPAAEPTAFTPLPA